MTTWMFVALLWFDGGASWPDTIWSFNYGDRETCEQAAQKSVLNWSQRPRVHHVIVSECFRWVHVRNKGV